MPNTLPNIYKLKRDASGSSLYGFTIFIFTILIIIGIFISSLSFVGSWWAAQWDFSIAPDKIRDIPNSQTTKILANDGSLLYEMYDKENREEIEIMELKNGKKLRLDGTEIKAGENYIPLTMQHAMLALEDDKFYTNESGLPVSNILGAAFDCVTSSGRNCRGASGIYQQLVKNKTNEDSKSLDRKIQEIITAQRLGASTSLSHQDVLKMYLNTVSYGRNAHGVQKAAQTYFQKDIKDVTIDEACQLAAFPQIPPNNNTKLNDPTNEDAQYYLDRRNTCLDYLSNKIIEPSEDKDKQKDDKPMLTTFQATEYKSKPTVFKEVISKKRYPHFVDYVIQEIAYKKLTVKGRNIFGDPNYDESQKSFDTLTFAQAKEIKDNDSSYGENVYNATVRELKKGGYEIRTTIDPKTQEALERNLAKIPLGNFNGNNYGGIILDGSTGSIVAMVGSKDFNDINIGGQTNHIAKLSPYSASDSSYHTVGSTYKIYDYTAALLNGANPGMRFSNACRGFARRTGNLSNYGLNCSGDGTLTYSLRQSKNVSAAKALYIAGSGVNPNYMSYDQDIAGLKAVRELSEKMGVKYKISTTDALNGFEEMNNGEISRNTTLGSAAAIGTDVVNLTSHATGVNTLAQSGALRTATPFLSIKHRDNQDGEVKDIYNDRMSLPIDKMPYPRTQPGTTVIDQGVANQMSDILKINTPDSLFRWSVDGHDVAGKSGTASGNVRNVGDKTTDFTIIAFSKKYTSLLWAGRTNKEYSEGLRDNTDSTENVGVTAMKPLMQEIHAGLPETRFSFEGLQDSNGMKLTPKQIQLYSQTRKTY
jgi:membrane peptidoglycan carboxypeptidase